MVRTQTGGVVGYMYKLYKRYLLAELVASKGDCDWHDVKQEDQQRL